MQARHASPLIALWIAAIACGSVEGTGSSSSSSGSGGSGGSACSATPPPPPAPSNAMCERVMPGRASPASLFVDLSAAHAALRFFSPIDTESTADEALVSSLATGLPNMGNYAVGLDGIACVRWATQDGTLPMTSVHMVGDVAIVSPGLGNVVIPEGANAAILDLRGVPNAKEAPEMLSAAIAPLIATPFTMLSHRVRRHQGLHDAVFSSMNVYKNKIVNLPPVTIAPTGQRDLPLAVMTSDQLSPWAAEAAIALRTSNRAWLVGESVLTAVAETRFFPVIDEGVAVRVMELVGPSGVIGDEIPADRRFATTEERDCFAAELGALGPPPAYVPTTSTRPALVPHKDFNDIQPALGGVDEAMAAVLVAHGAARTFFPYFETVGDTIDDRLIEVLTDPQAPTLPEGLQRFGEALHDGHNFVINESPTQPAGFLPVIFEDIAGEPVVRRSLAVGVSPGDTIIAIDGKTSQQWFAEELARTSAATPGYQFNIAARRLKVLSGPVDLTLRDPDGVETTITFQPQPLQDYLTIGFSPVVRPAGPLADLGAPSLYYINMADDVLTSVADFKTALAQASSSSTGLVIDMRGYPGIDHYEVAQRLIQAPFSSPIFRVPVISGLEARTIDESSYMLGPLSSPSFSGPIALIVGHATVSAAENFSIMLVDAGRVKVFGRQSAATNGNITGVEAPGAFGFSFTGMEVRHADAQKSVFHGIGIVPEVESQLTAAAFRDGIDPELEDAVAWLLTN